MTDTLASSIIGGLFVVIGILVSALVAVRWIGRRRASNPAIDAPNSEDMPDDERAKQYEDNPGQLVRDVIQLSHLVSGLQNDVKLVKKDAGLVAQVAYRAIRQIEALSGATFIITADEREALERTRPVI